MASITDQNRPVDPLWQRILFSVPVLGWIARDIKNDIVNLYWAAGLFASAWIIAISLFGYAAFILPLLVLVPTVFVVLIIITLG